MKNQYSSLPDEYITGTKGDEGHHEGSTEIVSHKEEIERICTFISTIVTTAERHVDRAIKIGEGIRYSWFDFFLLILRFILNDTL